MPSHVSNDTPCFRRLRANALRPLLDPDGFLEIPCDVAFANALPFAEEVSARPGRSACSTPFDRYVVEWLHIDTGPLPLSSDDVIPRGRGYGWGDSHVQ